MPVGDKSGESARVCVELEGITTDGVGGKVTLDVGGAR